MMCQVRKTGNLKPDMSDWPIIDPLPSYERGRERPWRATYHYFLLHLVLSSVHCLETSGAFLSSQVIVKDVSIFAPSSSPNTDGIDPGIGRVFFYISALVEYKRTQLSGDVLDEAVCVTDSSTNVCVEDCYISNGDDLVALKSGWDEYGIAYGRPSAWHIVIRRVTGSTPFSGIAIGSEMSGGIRDVVIEDVHLFNMGTGIRIKTAPGRGGYVSNITITGVTMENVQKAIDVTANAG
ncbi:hypothetical protein L7F22_056112 [Adiantum nelumboides]|nr:hypothetical protein [Adiantum nelumboides]